MMLAPVYTSRVEVKPTGGTQQGFALVIALSLMAFVLLLVLTMSTLVQVETQSSVTAKSQLKARQNAMLGLYQAIGNLQKYAGPDQRVTARADILSANNAPSAGTNSPLADTEMWTGVWKTADSNNTDRILDGDQDLRAWSYLDGQSGPQWLVSGLDSDPTSTALTAANSVLLETYSVDDGVGGIVSKDVRAPIVELEAASGQREGYAYWVDDEGIKARVDLINPWASVDATTDWFKNQLNFSTAQRNGIEVIPGLETIAPNASSLSTLGSFSDLQIILNQSESQWDQTESQIKRDVSVHSKSILSDARFGGLRKDLTAAFADTNWNAGRNNADNLVFSEGGAPGIRWDHLRAHYDLYKPKYWATMLGEAEDNLGKSRGPLQPDGEAVLLKVGTLFKNGSNDMKASDMDETKLATGTSGAEVLHAPLRPVMIRYSGTYGVTSKSIGVGASGDEEYELYLLFFPEIVLWNPHNVAVRSGSWQIDGNIFGAVNNNKAERVQISVDGVEQLDALMKDAVVTNFQPAITTVSDIVLQPGEVIRFGLDDGAGTGDTEIDVSTSGLPSPVFLYPSGNVDARMIAKFDMPPIAEGAQVIANLGERVRTNNSHPDFFDYFPSDVYEYASYQFNGGSAAHQFLGRSTGYQRVGFDSLKNSAYDQSDRVMNSTGSNLELTTTPGAAPAAQAVEQLVGQSPKLFGFRLSRVTSETEQGAAFPSFMMTSMDYAYTDQSDFVDVAPSADDINAVGKKLALSWEAVLAEATSADLGAEFDMQTSGGTEKAYFGDSYEPAEGTTNFIMHDVPRQPLVSIGQFTHINLDMYLKMPNSPIGNSLPALMVPRGQRSDGIYADYSYLLNESLFDTYFFSTVPDQNLDTSVYAPFEDFDGGYIEDGLPLANSRFSYYVDPQQTGAENVADLRGIDTAAAHLFLEGGFNINSTSVNAWRALLSSLSKQAMSYVDSTGNVQSVAGSDTANPIPRFGLLHEEPFIADSSTAKTWKSSRSLSGAEVDALAAAIVSVVKERGPFLGVGDFVNRRIAVSGAPEEFSWKGAIEEAIEIAQLNLGAKAFGSEIASKVQESWSSKFTNWSIDPQIKAGYGQPSWLTQADFFKVFAPVITARSDTFRIRTCGEVESLDGKTVRAYCEAVVQRVPEFVDSIDAPETPLVDLNPASSVNSEFGRQFRVVSVKWLSEDSL